MANTKVIKSETISTVFGRYVILRHTKYGDYNFEVVTKDGTSRSSTFHYDASEANDRFNEVVEELKQSLG